MTKKEKLISTILNTPSVEIKEIGEQFCVYNHFFDTKEEAEQFADKMENMRILVRIAEELGIDYGYDGRKFTLELR